MKPISSKTEIADYPQMISNKLFNNLINNSEVVEQGWWDNHYPGKWVVKNGSKYYELRENQNLTHESLLC